MTRKERLLAEFRAVALAAGAEGFMRGACVGAALMLAAVLLRGCST